MAANTVSLTAPGYSTAIPINLRTFRGGVGLIVHLYTGTSALYDVEVTGIAPPDGLAHWNLHDILQGQSANMNSNLVFPVSAVRLHVYTLTGPGPVFLSVVQVDG